MQQQDINDIYVTAKEGRGQDAISLGRKFDNPWVVNIANAYVDYMGRLPTPIEVEKAYAAFAEKGGHGESYVAQLADDEQNSPENVKKKQDEKAKQYQPGIASVIKSTLGRDPTPEETQHFASLKAQGFDDYEIGQALQQLPEYQQKQDAASREALRGELSTADQKFFNDSVMPTIQAKFAMQGRTFDGSGFQAQIANAAKDIESQRSTYLAQMGREDYTNQRGQAVNQYLNDLSRNYSNQDYAKQRSDSTADQMLQRQYQLQDYNTQASAYNDYLRNYGKRGSNGLTGAVSGAAGGAATGTMILPGWGTAIGAGIGGIAGYFGSKGS